MIIRLSLTRRLTLLFALVSATVLLGLGGLITRSVAQHFEDLDRVALTGKVDLIAQALQAPRPGQDLHPVTAQVTQALIGHHDLAVLMLDADGETLLATAPIADTPDFATRVRAAQTAPDPQAPLPTQLWTVGTRQLRVVVADLPAQPLTQALADSPRADVPAAHTHANPVAGADRTQAAPTRHRWVRVAVAADTAHHQSYLRALLNTLWVFIAAATVLSSLLGWAVVRSGLAPLRAMREQTTRVTAQQLHQRLPVDTVPQELAELARSLNAMLARLDDAFQRLTAFSSDIAHELRTPVSNLMTQTQVALSQPRSAAEYRAILESNAEEFDAMARMIADMLLLAKADNGLTPPRREPLNLAAEVHTLFDYYDALAEERGLTLRCEGQAWAHADRLMLRRALGNLLSNAVRHACSGSTIRVELTQAPAGDTRVAVTNTGDTIAPEALGRIFDRFFRLDAARQKGDGAGLGLAIARAIARAHGGTLTASSIDGLTRFVLTLPA